MKIHIEADSTQELITFMRDFLGNVEPKTVTTVTQTIMKESPKEFTPDPAATVKETVQEAAPIDEPKQKEEREPKKVTKEDVRAIFTTLMKAGMQDVAKALTAKYGAKRVPDIQEKDYEKIYWEGREIWDKTTDSTLC